MVMDCKLCSKRFTNGKALGAHMRSHYAILPLPPKTPQRGELAVPLTESTSSDGRDSSGDKSLLSATYGGGLRENPRKSSRLPDPAPSVESESGSIRARLKREKGLMNLYDDEEVSEEGESRLGTMEDVAMCLMMLSRDVRGKESSKEMKIFRCEICDKVFKSSQGLGSHRATHFKRFKSEKESARVVVEDQVHECPFCPRIFKSAQALGGHKKSHFTVRNLVDLNLPSPAAAVEVVNGEIVA